MKQGKHFPELLMAIKEDKLSKKDLVGDTRRLAVKEKPGTETNMILSTDFHTYDEAHPGYRHLLPVPGNELPITRLALQQICTKLNIPFKYAERLYTTHPDLLAIQINGLFNREPKKVMVRTLRGNVRAVLSNRYRILDNFDVAAQVVPIVQSLLGVTWDQCIKSCEVTDNRMYIKVVHPNMVAELPPPEGYVMGQGHNFFVERVQAGIKISNSEVGLGSLGVAPAIYTERCTNMAVFESDKYTKYHVGREHNVKKGSDVREVFSDETRSLEDAATLSKIKDITRAALDGTIFQKNVKKLQAARMDKIEGNPVDAVEVLADKKGLTQDEADLIINNLITGADLTRYGLHAAVTRAAEDLESYDRASELESLGGEIIELPQSDWKVISQKAA